MMKQLISWLPIPCHRHYLQIAKKKKKKRSEREKKDNNLNWKINTNKDCHILSSFP